MKYNNLEKLIHRAVFSIHDLELSKHKIFDYQLNLWVKKDYLVRLKNGIYAFSSRINDLNGELISSLLYEPSYISLESALSYYGFIPEMVYAFTAVTARITRTFNNSFGTFIYHHIKHALFWGYQEKNVKDGRYLIAEPEKAILDYLYFYGARIRSQSDFDNIRFNGEQIKETLNKEKYFKYVKVFNSKKMTEWAKRCLL